VRTSGQLEAYLRGHVWNVGHASLPFVAAAHDAPHRLAEFDAYVDTLLLNHVANRASRTQGRAFASTCMRVFEGEVASVLAKVRVQGACAHLAPVFGATFAALGVERPDALALYLYLALRAVASAAIRLGIVGPHEAQRLQGALGPTLDRVLTRCEALRPGDAATVAPLLDIMGATHDGIYSRLFQS
jgi:urease accessory protein